MIDEVLVFKRSQEALLREVFPGREDFEKFKPCVREALEGFLNKNPNQTAEFLAKYLDYSLKKENNLDELVEEVVQLFRVVKSKDVFEEFY